MPHDRLSSTDAAFLAVEQRSLGMHVGAVLVLDGAGLVRADGGVDIGHVRACIAAGIAHEPRFAQRLCHVPLLGTVWVDDPRFTPDAHVLHTALPRPGSHADLMRLAGRIFAHPLDQRRPLWEIWIVEGLERGRFAVIAKAHHAMIDGIAGIGVLASLLSTEPSAAPPVVPPRDGQPSLTQRASKLALAAELLRQRAIELEHALGAARAHLDRTQLHIASEGVLETLREGLVPATRTSLNPDEVGPRRGFAGARVDLERVKRVKRAFGGTLNDAALTIVTGALRRYLARRGDDVDAIHRFRALVPVDLRSHLGEQGHLGNHLSLVLAPLPIHMRDPRARHAAVRAATEHLKTRSHEIEGAALIEKLADLAMPSLVANVFRTAMRLRAFNVVVTNVPGPPFSLYLGPSRVEEMFALVPLFAHQGLGVALVSYDGGLFFGLHTDPDVVPDGDVIAEEIQQELDELEALAEHASAPAAHA